MSAEGMGLAIGFATTFLAIIGIFITLVKQARDSGEKWGNLTTIASSNADKLEKVDAENKSSHEKLFTTINETNVYVAKIGENLSSLNSVVTINSGRITALEKVKPIEPPCQFHIDLEKGVIEMKGEVKAIESRVNAIDQRMSNG